MATEADKLALASNDFGFALYDRMRGRMGNVALSPTSISAALAMAYGGAKRETAAQIQKVAHFPDGPSATMTSWGDIIRKLLDPSRPMKVRIANRLFAEALYTFDDDYLERTQMAFDAPLEPLDFKNNPERARDRINDWVAAETEERIRDILPDGSVTGETRLTLVNAIYFLADWDEPFDKSRTRSEPFHLSETTTRDVPMMKRVAHLPLATIEGARVLELPYKGGSTAMWVVLPDAIDGLAEVEMRLPNVNLEAWRSKLHGKRVLLELPRVAVTPERGLDLAMELKALGMTDAFIRERADFTGIANPSDSRDRLVLSNVFHKAYVRTDENGTEAAAATAVMMMRGGAAPAKPVVFRVDRPYLFFIVDRSSLLVLFMGRVSDPTGEAFADPR